ncbi:hypothetical protein Gocc_2680 [Gaiella occulta]|uniref:Uncharacterized protein n=1 Tax=Gaiella occulta TaxID=1002870 RepID=A0A7M2YVC1_9ACTN|nr:hypothetical protein [Gaiella occulta]RDI73539.1 hypothetical protein Gocc_2680 [Gaiella occulta]
MPLIVRRRRDREPEPLDPLWRREGTRRRLADRFGEDREVDHSAYAGRDGQRRRRHVRPSERREADLNATDVRGRFLQQLAEHRQPLDPLEQDLDVLGSDAAWRIRDGEAQVRRSARQDDAPQPNLLQGLLDRRVVRAVRQREIRALAPRAPRPNLLVEERDNDGADRAYGRQRRPRRQAPAHDRRCHRADGSRTRGRSKRNAPPTPRGARRQAIRHRQCSSTPLSYARGHRLDRPGP